MRRAAAFLLALSLVAASAPVLPQSETVDAALARARTEAAEAAKRLAELEAKAAEAGDEATRLRAEREAAAAAIEAAEAKISESSAALRLANAQVALAEQGLASRRAPLAALLAGIATMGRQPPLLALADHGSVDEMVRVKALLDTTMPVISRRTAALRAELAQKQRLASTAIEARAGLARSRQQLEQRRQRFAELETRASERAARLAGEAFGAGDRVLASDEQLSLTTSDAAERAAARRTAAAIASLEFAPARPMRGDSALPPLDFSYGLPASAPLLDGLGSVNRAGIVSRGIRLDTARGTRVIVPADGEILFAAPFRGQDGIIIIDHGDGWTSLLLNVASDQPRGTKVVRGQPLGRALGPIGIELRRKGVPVSAALIAASSVPLSNKGDKR